MGPSWKHSRAKEKSLDHLFNQILIAYGDLNSIRALRVQLHSVGSSAPFLRLLFFFDFVSDFFSLLLLLGERTSSSFHCNWLCGRSAPALFSGTTSAGFIDIVGWNMLLNGIVPVLYARYGNGKPCEVNQYWMNCPYCADLQNVSDEQ